MQRLLFLAALAALSACARNPQAMVAVPTPPLLDLPAETGWRAIVSDSDKGRLTALPDIWRQALGASQPRFGRQIRRDGELLDPGAARNHPAPPPGSYHCRLVKLGAAGGREPAYKSFPEFFCYIRGDRADSLFFTKQTGSELPGGYLHLDEDLKRLVLTGAKQHAAGDAPLVYGMEPDRDLVGVFERIGPFRWRLVLPWRDGKEGLDIYELTPVAPEQQAVEPKPAEETAAQEAKP